MHALAYDASHAVIHWQGVQLSNSLECDSFMASEVASRLNDDVGRVDFLAHLNSLASTGFAQENLQGILDAEHLEERDWAVGEALAEAWLSREFGVIWPWNMERDKRTPLASLPGADLVGFVSQEGQTFLAFGEVKSSSEINSPPNVMTGRSGMTRQIENLATDVGLLFSLLRWLQARCHGSSFEPQFNAAVNTLLSSNNPAIVFFGVLVRDTPPSENDLRSRGLHLATIVNAPASCNLLALYLPWPIANLPGRVSSGARP